MSFGMIMLAGACGGVAFLLGFALLCLVVALVTKKKAKKNAKQAVETLFGDVEL